MTMWPLGVVLGGVVALGGVVWTVQVARRCALARWAVLVSPGIRRPGR